jgi:hypothetical protein
MESKTPSARSSSRALPRLLPKNPNDCLFVRFPNCYPESVYGAKIINEPLSRATKRLLVSGAEVS